MAAIQGDVHQLTKHIVVLTEEIEATDHVGKINRLFKRRTALFAEIDAHPARNEAILSLLDHADPHVRLAAAWHCRWHKFLFDEARKTVDVLAQRDDKIGRDAQSWIESLTRPAPGFLTPPPRRALRYPPKPAECSLAAAVKMIDSAFDAPAMRVAIQSLVRRAIMLWPSRHTGEPLASCFGGMPAVPVGWSWPEENGEYLLFLAQINCRDLHAAVGPNPLPDHGMLLFFGDHDDVNGCFPTGGFAVQYFATTNLKLARVPSDDFEPLPCCGLEFYDTVELPDWSSNAIAPLDFSKSELEAYQALRHKLSYFGASSETDLHASKLLGWPDLIQRDLGDGFYMNPKAGESLLLQIGWYHDGAEWQCWGPGGHIYVTLDAADLAARRFDRATLEMQCT